MRFGSARFILVVGSSAQVLGSGFLSSRMQSVLSVIQMWCWLVVRFGIMSEAFLAVVRIVGIWRLVESVCPMWWLVRMFDIAWSVVRVSII